jgi:hypothetical protein
LNLKLRSLPTHVYAALNQSLWVSDYPGLNSQYDENLVRTEMVTLFEIEQTHKKDFLNLRFQSGSFSSSLSRSISDKLFLIFIHDSGPVVKGDGVGGLALIRFQDPCQHDVVLMLLMKAHWDNLDSLTLTVFPSES